MDMLVLGIFTPCCLWHRFEDTTNVLMLPADQHIFVLLGIHLLWAEGHL